MQIFSTITNLTNTYDNIVIALGTFDGVHRGHQSIIQQAIHLAKSIGGVCVVFTFSNHPLTILSPTNAPLRISDNRCKQADMAALGVDILMNVPFTKKMSALAPLEFLQLLRDNFAPKYVVVGPNYSFGRKGEGTPRMLLQKGAAYGFIAEIHPVVQVNHHLISSTKIRNLLLGGQLEAANTMLGKPYRISGSVIPGDQRGRLLGFPTANLSIGEDRAMLPNGVYAVRTTVDGTAYRAVANIGT
ncbi:MAG: bifunctional riboflavin kinase/FMN adenylyltransferase, partial [Selenomonadaceae bacterium]